MNLRTVESHVSSTPWWVTGILMVLAACVAHLLTTRRDGQKVDREWVDRWEKSFADQARKITDAALKHYISADSIQNTPVSAALLLNELKRLQAMLAETIAITSTDSFKTQKAFRYFHDCISLEVDFQDPGRAIRIPNDSLISRIQAAEAELLSETRQTRIKKSR